MSKISLFNFSTLPLFNFSTFQLFNFSTFQLFNFSTFQCHCPIVSLFFWRFLGRVFEGLLGRFFGVYFRCRSSSSSSSSPPFPSSFVVAVRRRSSPFAVVRCCRRRRRRCRHRLLSLSLSSLFDDDAHRRPSHIARCRCLLIVVVTACIKGCACCAIVSLP